MVLRARGGDHIAIRRVLFLVFILELLVQRLMTGAIGKGFHSSGKMEASRS